MYQVQEITTSNGESNEKVYPHLFTIWRHLKPLSGSLFHTHLLGVSHEHKSRSIMCYCYLGGSSNEGSPIYVPNMPIRTPNRSKSPLEGQA